MGGKFTKIALIFERHSSLAMETICTALACKGRLAKNDVVLVRAESEGFCGFAAEGILQEFFAAFRAEIETQLLVHVVADLVVVGVIQAFENILNFLEVVAVVIVFAGGGRIKGGIDFDFDDVSQIVFRIEISLAQIA